MGEKSTSSVARSKRLKRERNTGADRRDDAKTLPAGLYEAIEVERANLSKAASLLACMGQSLEQEHEFPTGPYYPDLAEMAHDMVRRSINGLDSLALQEALVRNSVKDEFFLQVCVTGLSWASSEVVVAQGLLPPQQEHAVAVDRLDPVFHVRESCTLQ